MTLVPRIQMVPDGPVFSRLVQGYWRLHQWDMSAQQCLSFINGHIELGITTVDHAHVYGDPSCESLFGEALKLDPRLRDQIEIVSKCGIVKAGPGKVAHYDSGKQAILASVDTSLERLGTDFLDVLLIHRPDFLMDADEVAEAFGELRQSGKVRYFGVSNFTLEQMSLLQSRLDAPLITNQIEINPINLDVVEDGLLDGLQRMRVHPMAWSCLGGGRIFSDQSEQMERLRTTLNELAGELGADSIDQVVYAWVLEMPSRPVPILGSGNIGRVKAAAESTGRSMTREQWYRVWVASKGHSVP